MIYRYIACCPCKNLIAADPGHGQKKGLREAKYVVDDNQVLGTGQFSVCVTAVACVSLECWIYTHAISPGVNILCKNISTATHRCGYNLTLREKLLVYTLICIQDVIALNNFPQHNVTFKQMDKYTCMYM